MTCSETEQLLARYADEDNRLSEAVRLELAAHVAGCAACHALLEEQRDVRHLLRGRVQSRVAAGFASRVAARIDRAGREGWLDLANWRAWTAGLVPLAATLLLVAYLDAGRVETLWTGPTSGSSSTAARSTGELASALDLWPPAPTGTPATLLMQPSSSGNLLLETVLTGAAPTTTGDATDVR